MVIGGGGRGAWGGGVGKENKKIMEKKYRTKKTKTTYNYQKKTENMERGVSYHQKSQKRSRGESMT